MRAASDVTADTPTLKHAARIVTAVQCQCEVTLAVAAWLSQNKIRVRERWGNSDTFSNSVDKALGCKLRGMSERQQPCAKNIAHDNDGGAWTPRPPWIRP